MGPTKTNVLFVVVLAFTTRCNAAVTLRPLSAVYLPHDYGPNGAGIFGLAGGAAEQSAYDSVSKMVYTVGDTFLHVIDLVNVASPTVVHYERLPSAGHDVEVCGDLIGVAVYGQPGIIELFRRFDQVTGRLPAVASIPVGSQPDMLKFTKDCTTLLVANEGVPYEESGYIVDNEGTLSIIHLDDLGAIPTPTSLNFSAFNIQADEYVSRGVRWPYRGELGKNPNTFSQSLEPEYIAFDDSDTKAYVSLQENNAIAVVDLATDTIQDIYPLGAKWWKNLVVDASDKDGRINLASYDIYSWYQPDAIQYMELGGTEYIITANEGDSLDYEAGQNSWEESKRGKDFVDEGLLADSISSTLRDALNDSNALGRLEFSTVDGRSDQDPDKFERLYFFGGRSFSIFRAHDLSLIYDSGDEVERKHAVYYPEVFNADGKSKDPDNETPGDNFDNRSDKKGPECEALTLGEIGCRRLLFLAQERTSSIMIYSFPKNSAVPSFESIYRAGKTNETFSKLYKERSIGDLAPEDLRFVPASDNPIGKPLLLVTSTTSGTLSVYEVVTTNDNSSHGSCDGGANSLSGRIVVTSLVATLVGFVRTFCH